MTTEEKVDNSAWERFGASDHTVSLLTLQFFSRLHAHIAHKSLCTLDEEKLLG